jgi:hypothetical protein
MTIVLARASMLFSTSSATAFSGLLCDSAINRDRVPVIADAQIPAGARFADSLRLL